MTPTFVEYVWIGGNNELRSKTKVMHSDVSCVDHVPNWNYDGSSTDQAHGNDSEVVLKPRAMFGDPFRQGHHKLVLCDTYTPLDTPLPSNHRHWAASLFDAKPEEEPWFGLEQEYFFIDPHTRLPLGYDENKSQGQYYCSAGHGNAFGRHIADAHMRLCVDAGLKVSGMNAEVAPGQWEFQIGPCLGIEQGDHLWMARYILHRVAETHNVSVSFEPKPLNGDWNGSGCHTNYSTKHMREGAHGKPGLDFIYEAIHKLESTHHAHMLVYGEGNDKRMTGNSETSSFDTFSYGIADRGASVRIGNENYRNKQGYFEDRRPSSNCDPYIVTGIIFKTTCIDPA